MDARLGRNSGRIWNGRPIPRGVNLQQISNKIQDTLKWDTMLVIRSDGRHFEALPEFVCGKAPSYGRSSNLEINP